ncbi:MAG: S8 family serine peptidase [Planctomycetaceae bacterium]|jgi:subtilisin family serine protease|nr:S8 family serine peptidase [Planctomycetaceae bacterium]
MNIFSLNFVFVIQSKKKQKRKTAYTRRTLHFESLENRELLSVAPLLYSFQNYLQSDWFEKIADNTANIVPTETENEGIIENEWIIQLKQDALKTLSSVSKATDYLDNYGVTVLGGLGSAGMLHVQVDADSQKEQSEILAGISFLEYWQENSTLESSALSSVVNDPYANDQWGTNVINVTPAWNYTTGDGVVVVVLDTGVNINHPDLRNNIWTNSKEIAGNGIDDDGNGFVDDIHGWDTNLNTNDIMDTYGHGSHVAGIIGATANDNIGIAGIAPDVKILPVKTGDKLLSMSAIVTGINYAIDLKTHGVNICAINMSFGMYGNYPALESVIVAAGNVGIMAVAAAGNDALDNDTYHNIPSSYNNLNNVISVASTTIGDLEHSFDAFDAPSGEEKLSGFSNYGINSVDLGAPGTSIMSASKNNQTWAHNSGTSMAAPMVTGAVALLAALHPTWSPSQIKTAILNTVDQIPALDGKVKTGGRLNVGEAVLQSLPSPPTPAKPETPTNLTVRQLDYGPFWLNWQDNSDHESWFECQQSTDNGLTWKTVVKKVGANINWTMVDSIYGVNYQFRVRAQNKYGDSAWSNVVQIRGEINPDVATPTNFSVIVQNNGSFLFQWQDNSSNEWMFEIQQSTDGGASWSFLIEPWEDETSYTFLTPKSGVDYLFRIRAKGSMYSYWSDIVSARWDAHEPLLAPTNLSLVTDPDGLFLFQWKDNSSNETAFELQYSYDSETNWVTAKTVAANVTSTTYALTANTDYFFRVRAQNSVENSGWSNMIYASWSPIPKLLPPNQPSDLSVINSSDGRLQFLWKDNSTNEVGFELQRSINGGASWTTTKVPDENVTSTYYTPTQEGTYLFRIRAMNSAGKSDWSNTVQITWQEPAKSQAAPSNLAVSKNEDGSLKFTWRDNSSDERYFILRIVKIDGSGSWSQAIELSADTTMAVFMPPVAGTYRCSISAVFLTSSGQHKVEQCPQTVDVTLEETSSLTAPTGVKALPNTLNMLITWNAVNGATGYRVERSLAGKNDWKQVYSGIYCDYYDDTDDWVENGVLPETWYDYRVIAFNSKTVSAPSEIVTVFSDVHDFKITDTIIDSILVGLQWSVTFRGSVNEFRIERCDVATNKWTVLSTVQTRDFIDTKVKANKEYAYRIIALDSQKNIIDTTGIVFVKTHPSIPSAPTSLKATTLGTWGINLSWKSVTTATDYRVEYSLTGGNGLWETVTLDSPTLTGGIVGGLEPNTKYYFRVCAINISGESKFSSTINVTTPPEEPENLVFTNITDKTVTLKWNDVDNETGYRIEKFVNNKWSSAGTTKANVTEFTVKSLKVLTDYKFRVIALNKSIKSESSNEVAVTTPFAMTTTITKSGYALTSDNDFAFVFTGKTPLGNIKTTPTNETFQYELIVSASTKTDKNTSELLDYLSLGIINVTLSADGKTYTTEPILFSKLGTIPKITSLTTLKTVQFQLKITCPTSSSTFQQKSTFYTKVAKLTLPKWFV